MAQATQQDQTTTDEAAVTEKKRSSRSSKTKSDPKTDETSQTVGEAKANAVTDESAKSAESDSGKAATPIEETAQTVGETNQTVELAENQEQTVQPEQGAPEPLNNDGDESKANDTANADVKEQTQISPSLGESEKKTDSDDSNISQTAPSEDEQSVLGPLQLRVTNKGDATHCHVTKVKIPQKGSVVIDYPTVAKKQLAQKNFAQINALAGRTRFKVEG